MNKVILLGRLTRDPENRVTGNNLEITRFSLACNSDVFSRNADNNVEFVNCVAFGNTASTINKYCSKGSLISVIGRIHNSSYTGQDGNKRYSTEVNVDSFEFAGSRGQGQSSGNSSYSNSEQNSSFSAPSAPMQSSFASDMPMEDPYKNLGDDITLSSDDLPF